MKELLEKLELLEGDETHGTLGPNNFSVNDMVTLGSSKPRRVSHVSRHSVSLQTTVKMAPRGMNRFIGYTELFWDDKRKEYWLQGNMGKVTGRFKPEEVKVARPNHEDKNMKINTLMEGDGNKRKAYNEGMGDILFALRKGRDEIASALDGNRSVKTVENLEKCIQGIGEGLETIAMGLSSENTVKKAVQAMNMACTSAVSAIINSGGIDDEESK